MLRAERFFEMWFVQIIFGVLIMALSFILGFNYALTTQEPRVVEKEVGVLHGHIEDVDALLNGDSYSCDLDFHNDPAIQDTAICEPRTEPRGI